MGATGGCGKKALAELLAREGVAVTAVVRSESRLPPDLVGNDKLSVVVAPDGHLALSKRSQNCAFKLCTYRVRELCSCCP